jgi:hypothetical protein
MAKRARAGDFFKSLIAATWATADLAYLEETGKLPLISSQDIDWNWNTGDLDRFVEQCEMREAIAKERATECRQQAEALSEQ